MTRLGALAVVLLVFVDVLVCWCNNEKFVSTSVIGMRMESVKKFKDLP